MLFKKVAAVAALVVAVAAISASPAIAWTPGGNATAGTGNDKLTTTLTGGTTLTCDVTLTLTLSATDQTGTITGGAGTGCTTSQPNCTVAPNPIVFKGLPWAFTGTLVPPSDVTISVGSVNFQAIYSGASCGLTTAAGTRPCSITIAGGVTAFFSRTTHLVTMTGETLVVQHPAGKNPAPCAQAPAGTPITGFTGSLPVDANQSGS